MLERTLLIIKPDAVQRNLIGEIIRRIESNGYRIADMKMLRLTRAQAEAFYREHMGKPFYEPLIDFMIEAPCIPIVLEGNHVVSGLRKLIGATDPARAAEGTIRKEFAENGRRNCVHASDSVHKAETEIAFFFDQKHEGIVQKVQ
jgi:nucleoside-diphosphate kinase